MNSPLAMVRLTSSTARTPPGYSLRHSVELDLGHRSVAPRQVPHLDRARHRMAFSARCKRSQKTFSENGDPRGGREHLRRRPRDDGHRRCADDHHRRAPCQRLGRLGVAGAERHPHDARHPRARDRGGRGDRLRAERRGALAAQSRRTGQIAFAMPDVANPVYTSMVGSIQAVAREMGVRLLLHSTGAEAEDELAMLRDLKQRFVDGLILVLAADHRGARARARAGGGAGDRDRHAAEGHARRHGAAEVAARRGRGRAPPARRRPAADRVRQRAAADGAGRGAPARLPRRASLVRARARRRPLRRRRRLHGRARPPRRRAPARAREARRDLLRQRPARRRRARGAARRGISTCRGTSPSWAWTTPASPS